MATHLCQIKNNTTFHVRVVLMSMYGTLDFRMDAGESFATNLQDGIKALLAWNIGNNELVSVLAIQVTGSALFRVYLGTSYALPQKGTLPPVGTTFTPGAIPAQYTGEPLPAGPTH